MDDWDRHPQPRRVADVTAGEPLPASMLRPVDFDDTEGDECLTTVVMVPYDEPDEDDW